MKKTVNRTILIILFTALLMNLISPTPVKALGAEDGFNPSPSGIVQTIAVQPDGKILVGGYFTTIAGQAVARLARLNPDGSLDADFTTPTLDGHVQWIALQADGKILIAGGFTNVGGETHTRIARLHSDGSVDSDFNASITQGELYTIVVQEDGKILLGGLFGELNGIFRMHAFPYVWRNDRSPTACS